MKQFIFERNRLTRSIKLFLGILAFAASVYAATDYMVSIDCMSTECYEIDGQEVSQNLMAVTEELARGPLGPLCVDNNGTINCDIGAQQTIQCSGPVNRSCEDGPYQIFCDADFPGCQVTISATSCQLQQNQAICGQLLPKTKACELGLPSCNSNNPVTETVSNATAFKNTIIEQCSNSQSEICLLINDPGILEALTPENLDLANDTTRISQTQLFSYISQHLYQLRQGSAADAPQQSSYFFDDSQQGFLPGQQWAASSSVQNDAVNDELENVINLSQDGRLSMYVNASFLTARQDLSELEGKSKSQVAMLTTGLDYRLSQGVVGGALSYADGSTEYGKNDSEFDSANYNATVYGSFYKKQWWLDGALNYGLSRFNQERDIFCTAASCSQISNTYYADYNGSTLSGQIASGYDFVWGGFSLSPFAQWQLGKVKTDSYSEKAEFSGPTATIAIDEQSRDFSTASLGSYLRYSFATKKAVLVPYLRLVFNHELKDDAQYISGRLVGAANSDFIVRANDRDNNYATIGTGLSFQMQNGNAGFIDVETVEAYDNLSQYQLTGGWRFIF